MNYTFKTEENEFWWGGTSTDGTKLPFDNQTEIKHDFRIRADNQAMPMYLSSQGRCIWSETPFLIEFSKGVISIEGNDVSMESFGASLRDAYLGAMNKYFKPVGNKLPKEFFKVPQYNTWMQMTYNQTQDGVMDYAKSIIKNGFNPGILIIDEGWQEDYGNWVFDKLKFPDPHGMVDELHKMGFKVMLWLVPYVRADGLFFVNHYEKLLCPEFYDKYFLRTEEGKVALVAWWNGFSAILDFTNKYDIKMLDEQLHQLMDDVGIDGFKFDGGSLNTYTAECVTNGNLPPKTSAAKYNTAWNDFGMKYTYHELKDTFKCGGKRMIQRLFDRNHSWDDDGLNTLVPNALAAGILGYPFICPDMIGGGEWKIRELNLPVDQELFVRMAQCSALFPMMQFSWAPWEAVDDYHLKLIKKAHDLHIEFSANILRLVENAYANGEPILRSLEYNYPHCGYEKVNDIFMLGNEYLVAPILKKGEKIKEIHLPCGKWLGYNGIEYIGGQRIELPVTLEDIPYFKKIF